MYLCPDKESFLRPAGSKRAELERKRLVAQRQEFLRPFGSARGDDFDKQKTEVRATNE